MTSAPVCDPLADHRLTPQRSCSSGRCRAARSWRRSQRKDVLLPGDPAIRQAVQAAYAGPSPSQQEVLAIAEEWRPYRSLAPRYLDSAAFVPAEVPLVARLRSA